MARKKILELEGVVNSRGENPLAFLLRPKEKESKKNKILFDMYEDYLSCWIDNPITKEQKEQIKTIVSSLIKLGKKKSYEDLLSELNVSSAKHLTEGLAEALISELSEIK